MANSDIDTGINVSPWQCEQLRLTAFPNPTDRDFAQEDWWQVVTDDSYEQEERDQRTGVVTRHGTFSHGRLVLTMHPTRIDWRLLPLDEPYLSRGQFSVLGTLSSSLTMFGEPMRKWLSSQTIPDISRLAFGTILLRQVSSREDGYSILSSEYLPFTISPGSRDFLYQVNRRRSSNIIPDLQLNRLAKWSVSTLQFQRIIPAPVSEMTNLFACRLELDINTVPDFEGDLLPDQLPDLFDELIQHSLEIAEIGDRG